jgi:hypothetical protein
LDHLDGDQQVPKEKFRPTTKNEMEDILRRKGLLKENELLTESSGLANINSVFATSPAAPPSLAAYLKQESRHQRFSDVKEYLFTHDMAAGDARKVTISRFPLDMMVESSIFQQCRHVRSFQSDLPSRSFEVHVVDELAHSLEDTHWEKIDAGPAGVLIANALVVVPSLAPSSTAWTVVEYRNSDSAINSSFHGKGSTECLFALRNEKFSTTSVSNTTKKYVPVVQRIVVTGFDDLQPALQARRHAQLSSKQIAAKDLVSGGVIRMKDTKPFRENAF